MGNSDPHASQLTEVVAECRTVSTRAPQLGHGPPTAACAVLSPTECSVRSTRTARSTIESFIVIFDLRL
jgi:hypothetical protein